MGFSYIICYGPKSKSGKPQDCPSKTRSAHNHWAKCHISVFAGPMWDGLKIVHWKPCKARGVLSDPIGRIVYAWMEENQSRISEGKDFSIRQK